MLLRYNALTNNKYLITHSHLSLDGIVLWTGASKFEGAWVWDNGEPWGYTAWNSGEPSGNGGFMGIYGGPGIGWNWKERGETENSYLLCES